MDPRLVTAVIVLVGVPGRPHRLHLAHRAAPQAVCGSGSGHGSGRGSGWRPRWPSSRCSSSTPPIGTIIRSFQNKAGTSFIGLDNFAWFFGSDAALISLRNSLIWVVVLTVLTVGLGLLIALVVDRVRYESVAKSVIFVPLAITMTAASVIWTFMYWLHRPARPADRHAQRHPRRGRQRPARPGCSCPTIAVNTILLVIVMAWMWTGFAMVILSAALKGISPELLEAARVDGATERQVFRRITLPLLRADHGGGLHHDDHHRAQGLRHRLRHDQRPLRHRRSSRSR